MMQEAHKYPHRPLRAFLAVLPYLVPVSVYKGVLWSLVTLWREDAAGSETGQAYLPSSGGC